MKTSKRIYLDNASTTPVDQRVLSAMLPYLKNNFGNPSNMHYEGRIAKSAIEKARKNIAETLGVSSQEIIFTSGGTEADNLAILGIARANKDNGNHIIVSSIEHKAILKACKLLENEGFEITYLDVDKNGIVSLEHLKQSLKPQTILVSVMYANNEIGTIQPLKKISKILKDAKNSNPIFHSDACQAVGALPINIKKIGVDTLTISSSKIYGPKGIGCLYVNKKCLINSILVGGDQENGNRAGTENVASIVGFSEALIVAEKTRNSESRRLLKLRDYFLLQIIKKIDGVLLNGSKKMRLPNNINISIRGVEGESLLLFLDEKGVSCSTGSACSSLNLNSSYVLAKIGVPLGLAHCSVRFTLGRHTVKKDIDYTVKILCESVKNIRSISAIR